MHTWGDLNVKLQRLVAGIGIGAGLFWGMAWHGTGVLSGS